MLDSEYFRIMDEYELLEDGAPKMAGIKKAIQIADEEKDAYWRLVFRKEYIREAIFDDDTLQAILLFPEYAALYDAYSKTFDDYPAINFLWAYKWIIETAQDFYQVSYEKIIEYFEDFKKRCIENGFSLRSYYMKSAEFFKYIDIEKSKKAIEEFEKQRIDDLSDCDACELSTQVYFELNYGNSQKAFTLIQPILSGRKKCGEVPHSTYRYLLDYYIKQNDMENASVYEKLLLKEIKNIAHLTSVSKLLKYYTYVDINKGIRIFKEYLPLDIQTKNPIDKFNFELQAYYLLKEAKKCRNKKTIQLLLDKKFPLYKENGVYEFDELITFFLKNVTEIAQKFDKRNKSNYFSNEIK